MVREVSATIEPLMAKKGNRFRVQVADNLPIDARGPHQGSAEPVQPAVEFGKFTENGTIELAVESQGSGRRAGLDDVACPTPASA